MINKIDRALIEDWSRLYGRTLSETDVKDICYNIGGFISVLKEWDDIEQMQTEDTLNRTR